MNDIKIRQGETLELAFESDDDSIQTVVFKAVDSQDNLALSSTATFVDQKATIRVDDTIIPVAEYPYTVTFFYSDGAKEIWSGSKLCEDDNCEFAQIIICPSFEAIS